jgi:hypothetical protein
MDHTTDFALLGAVAVVSVTMGRPLFATCIALLGLFIYLR